MQASTLRDAADTVTETVSDLARHRGRDDARGHQQGRRHRAQARRPDTMGRGAHDVAVCDAPLDPGDRRGARCSACSAGGRRTSGRAASDFASTCQTATPDSPIAASGPPPATELDHRTPVRYDRAGAIRSDVREVLPTLRRPAAHHVGGRVAVGVARRHRASMDSDWPRMALLARRRHRAHAVDGRAPLLATSTSRRTPTCSVSTWATVASARCASSVPAADHLLQRLPEDHRGVCRRRFGG